MAQYHVSHWHWDLAALWVGEWEMLLPVQHVDMSVLPPCDRCHTVRCIVYARRGSLLCAPFWLCLWLVKITVCPDVQRGRIKQVQSLAASGRNTMQCAWHAFCATLGCVPALFRPRAHCCSRCAVSHDLHIPCHSGFASLAEGQVTCVMALVCDKV